MVSTLLAAALLASPAMAEGPIEVVARGQYVCELPDETAARHAVVQEDAGFKILSGSRYQAPQGRGTYLRRGDLMTMTSGPRNGEQYRVISEGFLRKIENGEPGRLRCVHQMR